MHQTSNAGKPPISTALRRAIKKTPRSLISWLRLLPDFIIIGVQKGGTTSLYQHLVSHPAVIPAFRKEVHFFDNNFARGEWWYQAHFPSVPYKYYTTRIRRRDFLTGEASPYYIFHPHAPKRIFATAPHVKLIVLLRNPATRAYSHYQHEVRKGIETLSFEEAIRRETERLDGENEKILKDENYYSFNHQHYSYLSRGIYIDQLQRWMKLFPKEQLLILKSEDFYVDPSSTLQRVFEFLRLPSWKLQVHEREKIYKQGIYPHIDAPIGERLLDYFGPHNRRLYECVGMDFGWNQ